MPVRHRVLHGLIAAVWLCCPPLVNAQQIESPAPIAASGDPDDTPLLGPDEPHRGLKAGRTLRAFRITGPPPVIDGRLDDEVWREAEMAGGFTQQDPDNGRPMTEDTFVQVAYDRRYLYVAVHVGHRDAGSIAAGLARRDALGNSTDEISIDFDPRHDHQTGYGFQTNPSGAQVDYAWFNDEGTDRDYDAVWEVRTARTGAGWTAEFRIPFSQLRFTVHAGRQVWGFNVSRQIRRRGEYGAWVARPRGERGGVSLFGHLVFDEPPEPPRRLELAPHVLARSAHGPQQAGAAGASAGIDLRMGLGTGATIAATVNPDFGHVEQDPAVLNLSVFESFFPEKRPFFLEDSRMFVPSSGLFQLFHSRRIGRAPGRLPLARDDREIRRPADTTVLGAVKLTGKGGGWTYGALSALTAREYAEIETPAISADGTFATVGAKRLVEPSTSFSVARLQRDLRGGLSHIGGIATMVVREQAADAFTGGIDHVVRWDRNRVRWDGHWVFTRASRHGGMQTSGGGETNISVSRRHWNASAHYDHFGRHFRVADLGFFRTRPNRHQTAGTVNLGTPDPWKRLRSAWTGVGVSQGWTNERLVFERQAYAFAEVQFRNFWQTSGSVAQGFRVLDDLDTRGGPPIVVPAYRVVALNVSSDPRARWRWHATNYRGTTRAGGWFARVSTGVSLRASDRLETSATVAYEAGRDPAQWIANLDADGDGTVDHLYGRLRRDVLDASVRATHAFSRDLTLQLYLQPFVAAGGFDDIRRLARPASFDFEPAALPFDPDFNRVSLRGNVVVRWEYRPGSTLFVAWDLRQVDQAGSSGFRPWRDVGRAFTAERSQVLMVKASYWLTR